jgi:hypothetical protein
MAFGHYFIGTLLENIGLEAKGNREITLRGYRSGNYNERSAIVATSLDQQGTLQE